MTDGPPGHSAIRKSRVWARRTAHDAHTGHWRGDAQRKVRRANTDRHLQDEIAVRAERLHRQLTKIRGIRRLHLVHERKKYFAPDVARTSTTPLLLLRNQARLSTRGEVRHLGVVAVEARCRVKREKLPLAVVAGAVPDHLGHLINLEIQGTRPIGNDVEFVKRIIDVNPINPRLIEQIYGWRTKQLEVRGIDDAFERRIAAPEQDHQFELVARDPLDGRRQIAQFEKSE